jgi:hypothetical protein
MLNDRKGIHFSESSLLLDDVEQFAQRKFRYRREIEDIIQRGKQSGLDPVLDDLLFTAKFVSNAHSVLQRVGPGSEGTDNLVQEYSKNLKRSAELLQKFFPANSENIPEIIPNELLEQSGQGLEQLLNFLYEISWVKNYLLDTKKQGT